MTKHKWHKEIKAWADGAEIQYKDVINEDSDWVDCSDNDPMWCEESEYRIKPQPKEPQYAYAWLDIEEGVIELADAGPFEIRDDGIYRYLGKIKIEDD